MPLGDGTRSVPDTWELGIDRLWTFLCSLDRFMLLLLVGAIAFSITLVVLLWTRWGHSRSLEKCVLLSFWPMPC